MIFGVKKWLKEITKSLQWDDGFKSVISLKRYRLVVIADIYITSNPVLVADISVTNNDH